MLQQERKGCGRRGVGGWWWGVGGGGAECPVPCLRLTSNKDLIVPTLPVREKEVVFHSVVTQGNSSTWLRIGDGGATYFRYPGYSQEERLFLGFNDEREICLNHTTFIMTSNETGQCCSVITLNKINNVISTKTTSITTGYYGAPSRKSPERLTKKI